MDTILFILFVIASVIGVFMSVGFKYSTTLKKHFNQKIVGEGNDIRVVENNFNYRIEEIIDVESGDIRLNVITNQDGVSVTITNN